MEKEGTAEVPFASLATRTTPGISPASHAFWNCSSSEAIIQVFKSRRSFDPEKTIFTNARGGIYTILPR